MPSTLTHKLNILRLAPGVTKPEQALKDPKGMRLVSVTIPGVNGSAWLYTTQSPPHGPKWLRIFDGNAAKPKLTNETCGGILLLLIDGRMFAATFGYSRHLLDQSQWDEGFGRRVTLNAVPEDQVRSVDTMAFDAIGKQTRVQASRFARLSHFGLNLEEDLVRCVTGKPRDTSLGTSMAGRDALSVSVSTSLRELPNL